MNNPANDSASLLKVATKAALAVEQQLRDAFRSTIGYSYKRDLHDIVTVHDRASEERISAVIRGEVPDSTIVGEEGGATGSGAIRWYVDPIDGTSNFARGIASWCVSIAAAVDDKVVAGVIHEPMTGNLFAASLDGAFLNGARLAPVASADESRAVLLTGFPVSRHISRLGRGALDIYGELLDRFLAVRNLGSGAIHLAYVAAGWADATMMLESNPWDHAAGSLLIEQTGGRFVGFRDGAPAAPGFLAPHYLAVGKTANYPTLARSLVALSQSSLPKPV